MVAHDPACRRRGDGRRRVLVLALAAGGAAMVGVGALAGWSVTNSESSGSLTASNGVLSLTDVGGSFSTAVSNLLPGDYLYRYVDVTNPGGDAPFTGTETVSGGLLGYVQVDVASCSVAWTTSGGTCSGTMNSLGTATPATSAAATTSLGTITSGATEHLRYTLTFVPTAPTSVQAATSTVGISISSTLVGGRDRTSS